MLSPIALIAFGFGRPREEGDMKNAGIPPIHGDGAHPKIEMRRRTLDSVASAWPLQRLSTELPAISRQSPAISIIHFSIKFS